MDRTVSEWANAVLQFTVCTGGQGCDFIVVDSKDGPKWMRHYFILGGQGTTVQNDECLVSHTPNVVPFVVM